MAAKNIYFESRKERTFCIEDCLIATDKRTKLGLFTFSELDDSEVEGETVFDFFSKTDIKRLWDRLYQESIIVSGRKKIPTDEIRNKFFRVVSIQNRKLLSAIFGTFTERNFWKNPKTSLVMSQLRSVDFESFQSTDLETLTLEDMTKSTPQSKLINKVNIFLFMIVLVMNQQRKPNFNV